MTRWTTTEPVGYWPAGVVIELISITYPAGRFTPEQSRQWLTLTHPAGSHIGTVAADSEVGRAFLEGNHQ